MFLSGMHIVKLYAMGKNRKLGVPHKLSGYREWLSGVVIGSGYREWLWGVVIGSGYREWLSGVVK